ncbi:MAG: hypothetical protein M3214_03045, partial [Actinomycetota bacterium]|nr:hypothetical protein [Actinomycetota bacterium]
MKELIPLGLGVCVGGGVAFVPSYRLRVALLPVMCLGAGALASWINGELASRWWAFFVSFDTVVAVLGAVLA